MTREEAITYGKDYYRDLITACCEIDEKHKEFVRMSLKALSQECVEPTQKHVGNALDMRCDDAISREELLKAIDTWDKFGVDDTNSLFRLDNLSLPHYVPYIHYDDVIKCIKGMPPVTPSRRKGHWIKGEEWCETVDGFERWGNDYTCSECGLPLGRYTLTDYCPNCGARMESEDKE